jgi:hypothetical protein
VVRKYNVVVGTSGWRRQWWYGGLRSEKWVGRERELQREKVSEEEERCDYLYFSILSHLSHKTYLCIVLLCVKSETWSLQILFSAVTVSSLVLFWIQ